MRNCCTGSSFYLLPYVCTCCYRRRACYSCADFKLENKTSYDASTFRRLPNFSCMSFDYKMWSGIEYVNEIDLLIK